MAALFGLSMDKLLEIREGAKQMTISIIVMIGEPCAGH